MQSTKKENLTIEEIREDDTKIKERFEKSDITYSRPGRKKVGKRISITLPEDLIEYLKEEGKAKGMGYQTLARMYLLERVEEEKKQA